MGAATVHVALWSGTLFRKAVNCCVAPASMSSPVGVTERPRPGVMVTTAVLEVIVCVLVGVEGSTGDTAVMLN